MGNIEVKFIDRDGNVGTHTFAQDSKRIRFPGKDYLYIDLSPLARCMSIQTVYISCCYLNCLDITPVIRVPFDYLHHHGYTYTLLSRETVESIKSPNVDLIQLYDTPSYYYDESTIRAILPLVAEFESDSWKIPFLGDCLVLAENIPGIGLVDFTVEDIYELLECEDREQRREYIISKYCNQIDSNGTTIGADIQQFMNCIPNLTKRIKEIVELRQGEMYHLDIWQIPETDEIDLHSLFLTAYGFEILSTLELRLKCSNDDFKSVVKTLDDLGFSLNNIRNPCIPRTTSMSKQLREYILKLALTPNLRKSVARNSIDDSHILLQPFENRYW